MTRGKDRQYNAQEEKKDNTMTKRKRQTIQCPREKKYNDQEEKTENTMTKRKRQTIQ